MPADLRHPLFLAAVPAILGSILLMHSAGVAMPAMVLQGAVFLLGGGLLWLTKWPRPAAGRNGIHWGWGLALAGTLAVPLLLGGGSGPRRWIVVGGVQLYLAAIFLPALLVVLGRIVRESPGMVAPFALPVALAAGLLCLQPDAAQGTALALACLPLWWRWRAALPVKVLLLALVLGCGIGVWQRPDPLPPVAHVEGVFALAAGLGPLALIAAILAALAPAAALLWQARRSSSPGLLAVSLYYLGLLALAPLQITPVPLLGFGASPILGYLLLAGLASRGEGPAPARADPQRRGL